MKAKAPASLQPNNGKIVSAQGCRRFCALPNYEHFAKRMGDQRGWRLQYAYSEYVAACREAGEAVRVLELLRGPARMAA